MSSEISPKQLDFRSVSYDSSMTLEAGVKDHPVNKLAKLLSEGSKDRAPFVAVSVISDSNGNPGTYKSELELAAGGKFIAEIMKVTNKQVDMVMIGPDGRPYIASFSGDALKGCQITKNSDGKPNISTQSNSLEKGALACMLSKDSPREVIVTHPQNILHSTTKEPIIPIVSVAAGGGHFLRVEDGVGGVTIRPINTERERSSAYGALKAALPKNNTDKSSLDAVLGTAVMANHLERVRRQSGIRGFLNRFRNS